MAPFLLIAGPCVIESEDLVMQCAQRLKTISEELDIDFVFKASFDKANRSSIGSFRGPGLEEGLRILARVKNEFKVPIISDVHATDQVGPCKEVLDIIQVPAFLCRQTDLLVEAGKSQIPVNLKKGQFMAPANMAQAAKKVESTGNENITVTERGVSFGYSNLVVDMRSISIIREAGYPVVFDATHSVQLPSVLGTSSGGDRKFVPLLARAAVAAGIDGLFMEVHPDPDNALCDGPNSWPMNELKELLKRLIEIDLLIKN
jgi:2-dehydro-3-deoxyphosphooctonate aldolase (KDO 8-P synthase)